MNTAFSLWGFNFTGEQVVGFAFVYIVVSVLLIIIVPLVTVRDGKESRTIDEQEKLFDLRSKVRQVVVQVVGGILVVATFIGTLQTIRSNDDAFNQKKAELFAKSVKQLVGEQSTHESRAEAMYVLSYVARSDRSYHRPVFDALAAYIVSNKKCSEEKSRADFSSRQAAMRIFGERRYKDDPTGKRFNLEKACLDAIDLRDEWTVVTGLIGVRLSGASMARVDFTRVEMENAELLGILASDSLSLGKDENKGRRLHKGVDGDPRVGTDDGELRRAHIAHFIDAGLEGANLGGAQLAGADFSGARLKGASFDGADISRASFKGAQGLEVKQFENACVGYGELKPEELALEQPYFSGPFRAELAKRPKFRNGIPPCLASKS